MNKTFPFRPEECSSICVFRVITFVSIRDKMLKTHHFGTNNHIKSTMPRKCRDKIGREMETECVSCAVSFWNRAKGQQIYTYWEDISKHCACCKSEKGNLSQTSKILFVLSVTVYHSPPLLRRRKRIKTKLIHQILNQIKRNRMESILRKWVTSWEFHVPCIRMPFAIWLRCHRLSEISISLKSMPATSLNIHWGIKTKHRLNN